MYPHRLIRVFTLDPLLPVKHSIEILNICSLIVYKKLLRKCNTAETSWEYSGPGVNEPKG